jgi:tetratricopeptide (TPR) repeat protein
MANVGMRVGRSVAIALAVVLTGFVVWRSWPLVFPDTLKQGDAAYARSDWQEALRKANQRLDRIPNDRGALRLLARASGRSGYHDQAQAIYRRLGSDRMQAEDYFLLAEGLIQQQRVDLAWGALELARRDDPNHPETLQELARLYAQKDQLEDATPLANQLASIPGWEARGSVTLGLLLKDQNDPAGSARALEQALQHDPALQGAPVPPAAIRKLLARELLETSRPARARAQLLNVLGEGQDSEADWLLSRAWLQEGKVGEAAKALGKSRDYRDQHPMAPEPSPFVGSAQCVQCHSANYQDEQTSRHSRTFHRASELIDLSLPNHVLTDPFDKSVVHSIERDGDNIRMKTSIDDRTLQALVDYAFGSGDRGMTLVGHDDAGQMRELRLSHYNDQSAWDRTTGHRPNPTDRDNFLGKPLSAQGLRLCLGCHTTNFRAARDQVGPEAADRGIGCERCHGPGGLHLQAVSAGFTDLAIAQPRLATAGQITSLCGQCHSPRSVQVSSSDPNSIRFQSSTLTWSRCYAESGGALSCVNCHNPHRDAETSPSFYEARCLACHSNSDPRLPEAQQGGTRPIVLAAEIKRVPCPVNPANDCLRCHMPVVRGVIPHSSFTDHHIRIHPETSADD